MAAGADSQTDEEGKKKMRSVHPLCSSALLCVTSVGQHAPTLHLSWLGHVDLPQTLQIVPQHSYYSYSKPCATATTSKNTSEKKNIWKVTASGYVQKTKLVCQNKVMHLCYVPKTVPVMFSLNSSSVSLVLNSKNTQQRVIPC